MYTKLIEAVDGRGLYLKALIGRFDSREWGHVSRVWQDYTGGEEKSLLRQEGWSNDHILVLDVSRPGPGAIFLPGGSATHDLAKKPVEF